jgi:hypothetical protein
METKLGPIRENNLNSKSLRSLAAAWLVTTVDVLVKNLSLQIVSHNEKCRLL